MSYHEIIDPPWLVHECLRIGRLGALEYIIDIDGQRLTGGHHELYMNGNTVFGKIGAGTERIGTIDDIIEKKAKLSATSMPNVTLTKREYFAAMAMQGILSSQWYPDHCGKKPTKDMPDGAAECAISHADALLKALGEAQ